MNILEEFGLKYGTDKGTKHNYLRTYHNLFRDVRESVKKVLEIGVAEGAGVRMFREYFPNAMIFGGDNEDNRIFKEDRIEVIKCDQSSFFGLRPITNRVGDEFDLIVDDGSHRSSDQLLTCQYLLQLVKVGGYYIIEDVADIDLLDKIIESINFNKHTFEYKRVGKRYDDCLIIIRRV